VAAHVSWLAIQCFKLEASTIWHHTSFVVHPHPVPMDFDREARGSTFNYAGRDQCNVNNFVVNVINNIPIPTPSSVHHRRQRTCGAATLPQVIRIPMHLPSSIVSTTGFAVRLIVNIVDLLRIESSNECRQLERALTSLCQSLYLTNLAILAYECSPLGQSLMKSICPEVELCCEVLGETLDKIIHYRENLKSTKIGSLWRHVWWNSRNAGELIPLRIQLSSHHEALNMFLVALNSYVCFKLHASQNH
jgi:hypothetical protein